MKRILSIHFLFLISLPLISQDILSGRINDEVGEPISFATVLVLETNKGTTTDASGNFTLKNVSFPAVIEVRAIGYDTKEISLNSLEAPLTVVLAKQVYLADEFIVSATRVEKNDPFAYSTISKEEITEMNTGRDVPYVVNQSPSVVASSDAGAGVGYTGLRIRGVDQTNINVTLNGIALNDAESHGVYWVNTPNISSSLSDIQIQRGVGTSTNGAGAFGATINLQTDKLQEESSASASFAAGSFNTLKGSFGFNSGIINKYWSFDGRLSKIQSDGYIDRASSDLNSYFLSGGFNNGKTSVKMLTFGGKERTYQAWYGVDQPTLDNDRAYNYSGAIYNADGSVSFYEDQTDNYQQDHYQLHLNQKINENIRLNLAGHYTYGRGFFESYHQQDYLSYYNLPNYVDGSDVFETADIIDREWLKNHYYGTTYNINYSKKTISIDVGGAYNRYDGDHFGKILWTSVPLSQYRDEYYVNNGLKDDFNAYVKISKKLSSKFNVLLDIQYRDVRYTVSGLTKYYGEVDFSDHLSFVNPKAGVSYTINNKQSVYYSLALANREPNRNDYLNAPNFEAKPERLLDEEVGYRYNFGGLEFNANSYFMYYQDQLVLTGEINNVGEPLRSNVGKSYRLGLELSAVWEVVKNIHWMPNITISRNKNLDFSYINEDSVLVSENSPLAYSPELIINNAFRFRLSKSLNVILYNYFIGSQYMDNTGSENASLAAYSYHDLRLEFSPRIKNIGKTLFFVNVNNVLDEKYSANGYMWADTPIYFPQAGINFMTGVNFNF